MCMNVCISTCVCVYLHLNIYVFPHVYVYISVNVFAHVTTHLCVKVTAAPFLPARLRGRKAVPAVLLWRPREELHPLPYPPVHLAARVHGRRPSISCSNLRAQRRCA